MRPRCDDGPEEWPVETATGDAAMIEVMILVDTTPSLAVVTDADVKVDTEVVDCSWEVEEPELVAAVDVLELGDGWAEVEVVDGAALVLLVEAGLPPIALACISLESGVAPGSCQYRPSLSIKQSREAYLRLTFANSTKQRTSPNLASAGSRSR